MDYLVSHLFWVIGSFFGSMLFLMLNFLFCASNVYQGKLNSIAGGFVRHIFFGFLTVVTGILTIITLIGYIVAHIPR